MAKNIFTGSTIAVAQVSSCSITAYDATTTYKLTVGNVVISVLGTTDANGTATALRAAWNASTHPYCTGITAGGSTNVVTLTGDVAGVPFTVTSSVTGGTGTISAVSDTTACTGPNFYNRASNWSLNAVPVAGDEVSISNSSINICWGLDNAGATLAKLLIDKSYTGRIGLDPFAFATTANGQTTNTTVTEYRSHYLAVNASIVEIGENLGAGSPAGSARIKLDLGTVASRVEIFDMASSSADANRPTIRIKANNASTDIHVRRATSGVGINAEVFGETGTINNITMLDPSTTARVVTGDGLTFDTYKQFGGNNTIRAAAATAIINNGGLLTSEGDFNVATWEANSGTSYPNHIKTGGNAIDDLIIGSSEALESPGGAVDATQSPLARTWDTVTPNKGSLRVDKNVVTINTFNVPEGKFAMALSEAA